MAIYSKVYLPDKIKYKRYIDKIYKTSWITTNGKFKNNLERRLEKFLKVKNVVLVSNGTIALQILYKALSLKGNVITTPFSYVATSNSLIWEGLKPNFIDIDKDTFNIDATNISSNINKSTSAILPVHVFGNPCDIDEINKIAKKNKLKVIYDASHCFNINYKGKSILSYGDASIMSLHATKIFHTIEGGAIITNNNNLAKKVRMISNFGKNHNDQYEILGINAKMNEFEAAMGLCNLQEFSKIKKFRKKIWNFYHTKLKNFFDFQKFSNLSVPNYSYFPIIFKNEKSLLKTVKLLNKNKIYVRRYFYPSLDRISFTKQNGNCKVSNNIAKKIICLPISQSLNKNELSRIIRILINSTQSKT
tara:strand:+ start:1923 stop:3008 length:1086 start_codon:yes stop_codon:yes gene_type:complete